MKESNRYLVGIIGALLFHFLVLLLPRGLDIKEKMEPTDLMEFQFLNEEKPDEIVEPPAQTKPTPEVQKPKEIEPQKSEPEPIPETPVEVVEDPEEIPDEESISEVVKPQVSVKPQVDVKPSSTANTFDNSSKKNGPPSPVSSSELDNPNFKPFGNKKPQYPAFAKKSGIEGWVQVRVLVDKKGKVLKAQVVDFMGHPSFKEATLDVAKGWRFPIPIAKGKRVEAWYIKKVAFQLRG